MVRVSLRVEVGGFHDVEFVRSDVGWPVRTAASSRIRLAPADGERGEQMTQFQFVKLSDADLAVIKEALAFCAADDNDGCGGLRPEDLAIVEAVIERLEHAPIAIIEAEVTAAGTFDGFSHCPTCGTHVSGDSGSDDPADCPSCTDWGRGAVCAVCAAKLAGS